MWKAVIGIVAGSAVGIGAISTATYQESVAKTPLAGFPRLTAAGLVGGLAVAGYFVARAFKKS